MNTEQARARRATADPRSGRADTSRQPGSQRHAGVGSRATGEEIGVLSFLAEILAGDTTWSVGEVRRLLDLREHSQTGLGS